MQQSKKKHTHHGKSTRDILDAGKVLSNAGLKEGQTFLDAGCGDGFISLEAAEIVGDTGKVYAVDIYDKSLHLLKQEIKSRNISNIKPILADITSHIPVEDNYVDIYFLGNVFHGLVANQEIKTTMQELKRILKPEGKLVVVDFKKIKDTPGPPLETRLDPEEIVKTLAAYNFQTYKITDTGPYHYLIIASLK